MFSKEITIPTDNLGLLLERLAEVNKKAEKLGVPHVTLTITGEFIRKEKNHLDIDEERSYTTAWLEGSTPKYEGWSFLASLEKTDGGTLVRSLPGYELDEDYRERGNVCDHCGTKRNRKHTFVVLHDDGTLKTVGRSCLKDFMGSGRLNPANIATLFKHLYDFLDGFGEDRWGDEFDGDGWGGGSRETRSYRLGYVLEITGAAISAYGWMSGGRARIDNSRATSDVVRTFLAPMRDSDSDKKTIREVKESWDITGIDGKRTADAEATVAWLLEVETTNDYLHNLAVLARIGWVRFKDMGLAVSALTAWRTAMARLDEINRRELAERKVAAVSEHVGTVGKRELFDLTVTRVIELPGDYGVTRLHIMEDGDGNRFKWFASSYGFDEGVTIKAKATVKAHGEYNGVKETVVNRIKEEAT